MPDATHNALRERTAAAGQRHLPASPHLLDLTQFAAPVAKPAKPSKSAPRGLAYLAHLLDERIHLRDLRVRRVSTHHMDWRDFPPLAATGLRHAVLITAKRFVNEHPLADLTIVTVFHLAAVVVWKIVVRPLEAAFGGLKVGLKNRAPHGVAAPTLLPVMPMIKVMPSVAHGVRDVADRGESPESASILGMKRSFSLSGESPLSARIPKPSFSFVLPDGWLKSAAGFAAAAALFVLPIGAYGMLGGLRSEKDQIVEDGMRAIGMLRAAMTAAEARDFSSANDALAAAADDFAGARRRLGTIGTIMNAAAAVLPINTPFTSPAPLLVAGEEAAIGGAELAAGLASLKDAGTPIQKLRLMRAAAMKALPHLLLASDAVNNVSDGIVPEEYRDKLTLAKKELPHLAGVLTDAIGASDTLETILGAQGERRYLVLFQNNSELRPTGGFIGSYALVDVKDGKIQTMEIPGGGSYDLQGSLGLKLSAPQPLRLINPRWQFQDANWYPDFPTSAGLLSRFYEKSGGPTVDGVIAINASLMEKLLAATGPIEMPKYGKTISAANFFAETQKQVELDYDKVDNKPKQFIADLAPKMLERVMSADERTYLALAGTIAGALREKDLQLWLRDADLQAKLASYGWDGAMRAASGDYLAIVHTNIAGQKTDLAMREEVSHSAKIMTDGSATVTLTISRTHTGEKGALFSGVRNVDFLRIYVPAGSELIEARGFESPDPKLFSMTVPGFENDPTIAEQERGMRIERMSGTKSYEEHGKTVFGNWVQTDPGETSVVTLTYKLPAGIVTETEPGRLDALYSRVTGDAKRTLRYSLTVQKQAGAVPAAFTSSVDLPRGFAPVWQSPDRTEDERGRLAAEQELRTDVEFELLAESK